MTRDVLIFGGLCAISLDMIDGNGDIVRGLDEDYSNLTNIKVHFDAIPAKELGEMMLVFLMDGDWKNENTNPNYVSSRLRRDGSQ